MYRVVVGEVYGLSAGRGVYGDVMVFDDVFADRDGEGIHASESNIDRRRSLGYGVLDGCAVSVDSGMLDEPDTLVVESGSVLVGGERFDVGATSVEIEAPVSEPMWAVVSVVGGGTVETTYGEEESLRPGSASRMEAVRPAPPDLAAVRQTVLAFVFVEPDSEIVESDVYDRRVAAVSHPFEGLEYWNEDLSENAFGSIVGVSRATDDGTNTPSGHAELCLWVDRDGEGDTAWQIVGTETYIESEEVLELEEGTRTQADGGTVDAVRFEQDSALYFEHGDSQGFEN